MACAQKVGRYRTRNTSNLVVGEKKDKTRPCCSPLHADKVLVAVAWRAGTSAKINLLFDRVECAAGAQAPRGKAVRISLLNLRPSACSACFWLFCLNNCSRKFLKTMARRWEKVYFKKSGGIAVFVFLASTNSRNDAPLLFDSCCDSAKDMYCWPYPP